MGVCVKCWEATWRVCWIKAASLDYDCLMVFYKDTWQHQVNSKSMCCHPEETRLWEKLQTSMEFTLKNPSFITVASKMKIPVVTFTFFHVSFCITARWCHFTNKNSEQNGHHLNLTLNYRTRCVKKHIHLPLPDWNEKKNKKNITPTHNSVTHMKP